MALVRRCDNCMAETRPPRMFSEHVDDWYAVYRPGDEEGLTFCSERCIMNYFTAKKMISEVEG